MRKKILLCTLLLSLFSLLLLMTLLSKSEVVGVDVPPEFQLPEKYKWVEIGEAIDPNWNVIYSNGYWLGVGPVNDNSDSKDP